MASATDVTTTTRQLDPETLSAETFVSDAYGRWMPDRLDLFHDMSASEGFLACGDSLLLECFCNWNVDWPEGCGQQVHVVYLVEKLLKDFTDRHGIFSVVFFECNRALWTNDPSKLLARDMLVRHLHATMPRVVHNFKNWWSPEWAQFVRRQIPSFIMMNDADQIDHVFWKPSDDLKVQDTDADNRAKQISQAQFLFRAFMVDCIVSRVHVVYTSRLVRKDCFMHGFVVRSSSSRFLPNGKPIKIDAIRARADELFGDNGVHVLVQQEKKIFPSAGRFGKEGTSELAALPGTEECSYRVRLAAAALKKVLENPALSYKIDNVDVKADLAKAYLLHALALTRLPIGERATQLTESQQLDPSPYFALCNGFFATVSAEAAKLSTSTASDLYTAATKEREQALAEAGEFCDAWDFRLNRKIIGVLLGSEGKLAGPADYVEQFQGVWAKITGAKPDDVVLTVPGDNAPVEYEHHSSTFALLPTEDQLVNQLIKGIDIPEVPEQRAQQTVAQLQEKRGWLKRSQLWQAQDLDECVKGDDLFKAAQAAFAETYDTTQVTGRKKKKMEMRMERSRAKFLHSIQSGAESMSGGFLPHGETRVITKDDKEGKQKDTKAKKLGGKAAEIAEKNRLALEQREKEAQERQWSNFYGRLEMKKDMSIDRLDYCAGEIARFVASKKVKDREVLARARVERLQLLEKQWLLICRDEVQKEKNMHVAVDLFRSVHELVKEYLQDMEALNKARSAAKEKKEKADKKDKKKKKDEEEDKAEELTVVITDDDIQIIRRILILLGLKDNCKAIDQKMAKVEGIEYQKDGKHKLPSSKMKSARVVSKDAEDINARSHVRFQMAQMGHLFDRSSGSDDPRVSFRPDPWQRSMLDAIDNRESILCCAPTSAGKTFISYYCIKEIMFSSNENVVVYVAPTRALCNQAAQDVYGIFGNKKYSASGWSLFGILGGGNYVQPLPPMGGPFMTQVLITIPSVFEHVMLSPRYQQWAKKVKYIIFDEVHCVDTSGEGHLWERLLMCTRAPFIALSATVGNAEDFRSWLASTQGHMEKQDKEAGREEKDRSYKVRGVYWDARWNDLQKFVYQPRTVEERAASKLKITNAPFAEGNIRPLHPLSTVTRAMLEKLGTFPRDLPIVAKESLALYDSMQHAFEIITCRNEGNWSDEDGNRVRFDGEKLVGRRGVFKGVTGQEIKSDIPPVPAQDDFEEFKARNCYVIEGGHVWTGVNDDDELEVVMSRNGEVTCVTGEHEIDGEIMEAMEEGGKLCPEYFFKKDIAITQARSREYEAALKAELMSWVTKGETDPIARLMVEHVMDTLTGGLTDTCTKAENVAVEQGAPLDTKAFIENNFTDMLLALNSQKMLPAIVFNFDQAACEDLARKVVEELENAENAYKDTPEWKNFVKKRQDLMNQQKKDLKAFKAAQASASKSKKDEEGGGGGDDGGPGGDMLEMVDYSIPDILPAFAFCHGDRGDGLPREEFDRFVKDIDMEPSHHLVRALERGIGVHHAGLPAKYRNYVEKLFRMKRLKVVVATETLALGIHSPCRTVVLAGDDVRLSTMQFRQMSGRAGRRGQDYVGYVIFYGIPEAKIIRLMTSGLPTLRGHMSIDATTVLRMSLLHSHAPSARGRERVEVDQDRVRNMSQCMLNPLFTLGKHIAQGEKDAATGASLYQKALRLQWRYTTDYLQREGLITPTGAGQFLPGLTTRALYSQGEIHMNPPNLLFSSLLRKGVFQKVCANYKRNDNAYIVAQMSMFLATIFTRNNMGWKQEIHRCNTKNPDVAVDDCPHDVILPQLTEIFGGEIWKCMQSHNMEALDIYSALAMRIAQEIEAVHGKDAALPLSNVSFAKKSCEGEEGLLGSLAAQSAKVAARSPFIAVCGLQDKFHCLDDLVLSLRSCMHLEEDSLPILDYVDLGRITPKDRFVRINAVAVDYIEAGSQIIDGTPSRLYLEVFNGLSQSSSWALLNRFCSTINQIADLVERLVPAWPNAEKMFTCCNTVCPPGQQVFIPSQAGGLYKCHDCDKEGIDTWMCPKCYDEGEECVTKQDDRPVKNKTHVFFRHIHDKFVQTMSHIAADLEPLSKELGKAVRQTVRKKKVYKEIAKPKRPILQRPKRRGAQLFKMSHKR